MTTEGLSAAPELGDASEIPDDGKHVADSTSEGPPSKKVKSEDVATQEIASSESDSHFTSDVIPVGVKAEHVEEQTQVLQANADALDSVPQENGTTQLSDPVVPANNAPDPQADDDEDDEDLFGTADDDALPATKSADSTTVVSHSAQLTTVVEVAGTDSNPVATIQESEQASELVVQPQETVIPRKSAPTMSNTAATYVPSSPSPGAINKTPGTRYGLPAGVNVPASIVKTRLLEAEMNTPGSKLMDVIKSLPINLINDALTEYDDAVEIKGAAAIRNHGAYLYGVVKRYVSVHERAMSGEGTGILPMGEDGLTPTVEIRLDQLVSTGFCTSQEMNEKVKSKIRMLSEKDALFALDELSSAERSSIRNFGSYFMGILNRYMRGDASTKNRTSDFVPGHHQPHQQQHSFSQQKSHFDRPREQKSPFDRSRERDRFAPRDNHGHNFSSSSSSSFRDRSRDRNDDRREYGGGGPTLYRNNESHSGGVNNPMYDNRQMPPQQPPWQNPNPSPPQGGYGGPMGGGGPPTSHMNHSIPPQGPPMNQSGMHGMPSQPNNMNFPPPQQQPHFSQQQPSYMQQPQSFVQQQSGYPSNPQQPHGMQNTNSGMYQQHQPPMGNMMGQPQQQGPMGNQSNQQSYVQHSVPSMNQQAFISNPMNMPQSGWRPPQEPPQLSIDILGLADKAASAIQALGANRLNPVGQGYPPQQGGPVAPQQGGPVAPQQGYPSYGGGHAMNQGQLPSMGMQQQHQYSSQNQQQQYPPQQHQPYPPQNQQQQYPPPSYQHHGGQNSLNRPNDGDSQPGRRRTTAALHELPMAVQYAVQNLVSTGSVDGQPDEGILGMIIDLPEHMALAALQKFASIDKSSMRNKTAYLAGVLRRELENIQRR